MKLSELFDKYYIMGLVGSEIVEFFAPDPPDEAIRITFGLDGENYEQYFNDQEIQILDHPEGGFFVIDVDGKDCGFIALDGVNLKNDASLADAQKVLNP